METGHLGAHNHGGGGSLVGHGGLYLAEGYFVPRHTAKHSFLLGADDTGVMLLSTDDKDATMQLVAGREHHRGWNYYNKDEPMSAGAVLVNLEKGKRYAYQAFTRDQSSTMGSEGLKVAVRVHDVPLKERTWAESKYHTPTENILIKVESTAKQQVQQLVVKGVGAKGSFHLKGFPTSKIWLNESDSVMAAQLRVAVGESIKGVEGAHKKHSWWYTRATTSTASPSSSAPSSARRTPTVITFPTPRVRAPLLFFFFFTVPYRTVPPPIQQWGSIPALCT